jgi:hypothetical protein
LLGSCSIESFWRFIHRYFVSIAGQLTLPSPQVINKMGLNLLVSFVIISQIGCLRVEILYALGEDVVAILFFISDLMSYSYRFLSSRCFKKQ